MDKHSACPCFSGFPFGECCGPYLERLAMPDSAAALMRSRFSAFQLKDAEYLKATWDAIKRPKHLDFEKDERLWSSLDILSTVGGQALDERGVVEFKARYDLGDDTYLFHEISRFVKREGRWWYLDATFPYHGKVAHKGEWLKNAPCTCGSGKKFKKCCG